MLVCYTSAFKTVKITATMKHNHTVLLKHSSINYFLVQLLILVKLVTKWTKLDYIFSFLLVLYCVRSVFKRNYNYFNDEKKLTSADN